VLGVKQKRLSTAPSIQLLAENNARQGFADPEDVDIVVAHLPEYLRDLALERGRAATPRGRSSGWRRAVSEDGHRSDTEKITNKRRGRLTTAPSIFLI
jgi:hypothetical protein